MGISTVVSRVATNDRAMALTFDDGSDGGNLSEILSILAANNIKCTFFLTGEAVNAHPSIVRSIVQQGHEVGNHSYSHPEFTQVGSGTIQNEMIDAENAIINATGVNPRPYFRPPYGSYNQTVLNVVGNLGYDWTILWTIDTVDWNGTSADDMLQNVLGNAEPGAIVLMHAASTTHTTEALPAMIQGLKARGYSLVKISDLISAPQGSGHPILRVGSTGQAVRDLQERLRDLGFNPGPIDGIFGSQTDTAVRAFQASRGLVVDGIVGPNTWAALDSASGGGTTPPPDNPPSSSHPLLRVGSSGEAVRDLQERLRNLGFNPGPIDGIFGSQTDAAVRAFQASRGLVVDGIVGNNTWAALDGASGGGTTPPPSNPPSHPLLSYGDSGESVRYLQQALSKLGFDPGPIDGIFGARTNSAVIAYQSSRGLAVDGVVGNQTWAALEREI